MSPSSSTQGGYLFQKLKRTHKMVPNSILILHYLPQTKDKRKTAPLVVDQLTMESSTLLPLSQLSFLPSNPHWITKAAPFRPWKKRTSQPTLINCGKMYVPGFGEASPEAKGARHLHHFFTYVAVRIVQTQLEDYNPEANQELMEFLSRHSLDDGDKFCADLMRESPRHKSLALRILEVRSAYCKRDFEWDNLQLLAFKMVDESNTRLMREYVLETSHENET